MLEQEDQEIARKKQEAEECLRKSCCSMSCMRLNDFDTDKSPRTMPSKCSDDLELLDDDLDDALFI